MRIGYHYRTYWEVRVDGRLYEESRNAERKNEICSVLANLYPDAEITADKRKRRESHTIYECGDTCRAGKIEAATKFSKDKYEVIAIYGHDRLGNKGILLFGDGKHGKFEFNRKKYHHEYYADYPQLMSAYYAMRIKHSEVLEKCM